MYCGATVLFYKMLISVFYGEIILTMIDPSKKKPSGFNYLFLF